MIIRAAIKVGSITIIGKRHERHDAVYDRIPKELFTEKGGFKHPHEFGFISDTAKFLDRKQAGHHAFECGQIKELTNTLISEDLW